jgi:hypothetical protein
MIDGLIDTIAALSFGQSVLLAAGVATLTVLMFRLHQDVSGPRLAPHGFLLHLLASNGKPLP